MSFDLYADLAGQGKCPVTAKLPPGLASGFVDDCTAWFATGKLETDKKAGTQKKNNARNCYMKRAQAADLLSQQVADLLNAEPPILQRGWLAIEVTFALQTPWYSKDDRPFHVLDNPVRKDRVLGVPYMSAASWKGLLRWSCRMFDGLREYLEKTKGKLDGWKDRDWIIHLFGNEKGATDDFQRGALAFYPTWFSRIGFEVINPHKRQTRAGTQPIYYEVVPTGTEGSLRLLYAPLPGQAKKDNVDPKNALSNLLMAIEDLLTVYGFSAKRTAGWGLATIDNWVVRCVDRTEEGSRDQIAAVLHQLLERAEVRP